MVEVWGRMARLAGRQLLLDIGHSSQLLAWALQSAIIIFCLGHFIPHLLAASRIFAAGCTDLMLETWLRGRNGDSCCMHASGSRNSNCDFLRSAPTTQERHKTQKQKW
eukprot:s744_g24.t1